MVTNTFKYTIEDEATNFQKVKLNKFYKNDKIVYIELTLISFSLIYITQPINIQYIYMLMITHNDTY